MHSESPDKKAGIDMPLSARIERVYLQLEFLARNEAHNFSDSSKANIRRMLAELQRIRLLLLDMNCS